MPYVNGGFVDYNILTNPPIATYRTDTMVDRYNYVVHNMEDFTTAINPDYINITTDRYDVNFTSHIETLDEKFEKFAEKIYMIIREHTHIDISEEEFMKIIKDDN